VNTTDSIGSKAKVKEVDTAPKVMPVTPSNKIGRNMPCPCGSGKKYKKCCLNKREYTPGG